MHRMLILPDIRSTGYPVHLIAEYRISGVAVYQISGRIFGYFLYRKQIIFSKKNIKFSQIKFCST